MSLEKFNDHSFDVMLEGAKGMTDVAVAEVTKRVTASGVRMREVKTLIFHQQQGWVGVIFKDGREAIVPDVIEVPGRRKVFLPGAH